MRVFSWLKHLKGRRGKQFFSQMKRMWNFHRTPFDEILHNIFDQLDPYDAAFTFPSIASVSKRKPEFLDEIIENKHEVSSHGYKHVKYSFLSDKAQEEEFRKSSDIFDELGFEIKGFRAPYNNYNDKTIELVAEYGFEWDGGIGYRKEFRHDNEFFEFKLDSYEKPFDFVNIPLNPNSDDRLIDGLGMGPEEVSQTLISEIETASKTGGLIMFDLHPIRIGQEEFAPVLGEIVEYSLGKNAWIPTVSEAVSYWKENKKWKNNADFCLLLTGDIDNFTFWDYLRRLY